MCYSTASPFLVLSLSLPHSRGAAWSRSPKIPARAALSEQLQTSTRCQGPACSQLLNKARFFRMISYKLSVIREVCMSLKWLPTKSESVQPADKMHPVLAEQWVWIIRQKAVPVTPYLLSPAVPFFLLNFCPNTVTQWSKEKKETVTSQIERNYH